MWGVDRQHLSDKEKNHLANKQYIFDFRKGLDKIRHVKPLDLVFLG